MKLFTGEQIRQIDQQTISGEPVSSTDLMERAALQLLKWFKDRYDRSVRIFIFTGPGNNGGDGLALARLLAANRYDPAVFHVNFSAKTSDDWNSNMSRLRKETGVRVIFLDETDQFPLITKGDIIVDAILGTGLTRPVSGLAGSVIKLINQSEATVVSVDIPSGLFCEDNSGNDNDLIVKADFTLTFQFPKISFLLAGNSMFVGEFFVLPIGLSTAAINNIESPWFLLDDDFISPVIKKRYKYDHKGIFGHGLLIAGSHDKSGAAVLGCKAALRSGIGLVTCHIPSSIVQVIQCTVPEAMTDSDLNKDHFSGLGDTNKYSAAGIGPGLGTDTESQQALYIFFKTFSGPLVIDADALNILSLNKNWLEEIPAGTILTPHPKEFERLCGIKTSDYQRLTCQVEFSEKYNCIVVLKGAHTSVSMPDGSVFFNSTGNPGMATAGSGDVLTGILLSLLAQGYSARNAALLGVYLHGLAGDIAAVGSGYESMIASDLVDNLGKAFRQLEKK